jgi:CrcB protein
MLPARVKWRMQGVEREIGMTQLWIAAGGALGSLLRYWVTLLTAAWLGERMPWGTILINISGSLVIGVIAAMAESGGRWALSPDIRLFLMVGICGGYTTFSSFSLQTLTLFQMGEPVRAVANVLLSVLACLIAVWAGYALGSAAMSSGTG